MSDAQQTQGPLLYVASRASLVARLEAAADHIVDANKKVPELSREEPVAWKHDCAALLTNDVELWVANCPHCGKPSTQPTPPAEWRMVPVEILKDASYALGNFVSDHGWTDADMQAMDNLDAFLAAAPQPGDKT